MSGHKRLAMHKKAKGGKASEEGKKIHEYNAEGSPEVGEAKNKKPGFKKGGKAEHKKEGGHAEGHKAHKRLDKAARGGKIKKHAMGGSPFTAAAKTTDAENKGAGQGHENDGPKGMDKETDTER